MTPPAFGTSRGSIYQAWADVTTTHVTPQVRNLGLQISFRRRLPVSRIPSRMFRPSNVMFAAPAQSSMA